MKFTVKVDELKDVLKKTKPFISKGGYLPVVQHLRIDATNEGVNVVATNIERWVTTTLNSDVDSEGTALVSWALLNKFVASIKTGDIVVETVEDKVSFTAGKRNRTIRSDYPVNEFPVHDADYTGQDVHVLRRADKLDTVIDVAATDEARPILTGVLFNGSIVATDSYRLAVVYDACPEHEPDVLVPAPFLKIVKPYVTGSNMAYQLSTDNKTIRIALGDDVYESALIEGQFPNYKGLLPHNRDEHNTMTVDRKEFTDALKVMCNSGLSGTKGRPGNVPLRIEDNGVLAINADGVEETIRVNVQPGSNWGEAVGYNPWYLYGMIEHAVEDNVVLQSNDTKPTVFTDDNVDFLLMPVRMH